MILIWIILGLIVFNTIIKINTGYSLESFWRYPSRFGPHLPPRSSCGMLLPKPRYETSLPPDYDVLATTQDDIYYQHLNEPNYNSYVQYTTGGPVSNTRMAHISPQTACVNITDATPRYNEYYVKNRVGLTPYAVPAVKIPTDNSVQFVNITANPTGYL